MRTYVIRLWLPDRPGALGAVASRIGSVGANVVGIDILERRRPNAADQLVVEVPDQVPIELLHAEIDEVDGVEVDVIRLAEGAVSDPRLDTLLSVERLLATAPGPPRVAAVAEEARRLLGAAWSAAAPDGTRAWATAGDAPTSEWIDAFVTGMAAAGTATDQARGPVDVVAVDSSPPGLRLVAGRDLAFRAAERRQLTALAGIGARIVCPPCP